MNCALMVELRGRELRISHNESKDGLIRVRSGTQVLMVTGQYDQPSDATTFRINNEEILRYLKPNDVAYFDDGKIVAMVSAITDQGV